MKKTIGLLLLAVMLAACAAPSPTTIPTVSVPVGTNTLVTPAATTTYTPIPSAAPTLTRVPSAAPTIAPAVETNLLPKRLVQVGGSIKGIAIAGDLAYVGMGPRVGVIDISQHETPRLVGQSEPLPGLVSQLILTSPEQDSRLLIGAGKYLVVMDISNPNQPKPIQQLKLEGGISTLVFDDRTDILYAGGALYLHPGSIGYDGYIDAVAITPDAKLTRLNSVTLPEVPLSLALGKDSVFAGANGDEGGLYRSQLKSTGELSAPQQVISSTPEIPLVPTSMQVIGERLYLAYWGVDAYDITDPTQPVKLWSAGAAGINIATSFTIDRDHVHLIGFSIREPDIQVFGTFSVSESISGSPIGKISTNTALHNGDFIVADRGFKIFDTTDPQNLRLVGSYQVPLTNARDIVANESAVFVLDNGIGDSLSNAVLSVLSLPDLKPLGQVTTEFPNSWWEGFRSMALEGDRVYLAAKDAIWVYSITSPQPVLLGKAGIDEGELEGIKAVKLDAQRLIFAALTNKNDNFVKVLDLTDVQNPTGLGDPLSLAQGFGLHQAWNGSSLFVLLEYTRYSHPNKSTLFAIKYDEGVLKLEESLEISGYIEHIAADDNVIVLAGSSVALNGPTLSVVKLKPLKLMSTRSLPENGSGVAIIGESALITVSSDWDFGGEAQLVEFNLQSHLDPRQVDALGIAFSETSDVTILYSEPYIIIANGAAGLEVLVYGR